LFTPVNIVNSVQPIRTQHVTNRPILWHAFKHVAVGRCYCFNDTRPTKGDSVSAP